MPVITASQEAVRGGFQVAGQPNKVIINIYQKNEQKCKRLRQDSSGTVLA
jgi:hypothetical protein